MDDCVVEYRRIGRSDLVVSSIGMGAWQWGSGAYWGYGKDYGSGDIAAIISGAREMGINLIDTAELYGWGRSEKVIGELVGNDEKMLVATKYLPVRPSWPGVERAVTGSLRRLKRSVIDLYQVHWPTPLASVHGLMKNMEKEIKKGRIRYIGVSNYDVRLMEKAREALSVSDIVSNQLHYNLITRGVEEDGVIQHCHRNGISLIAWSPLEQGLLTGKYQHKAKVRDARRLRPAFTRGHLARLEPLLSTLEEMSRRHGRTVAQGALAWVLQQDMNIVIPGVKHREQLEENAGGQGWRFTSEEMDKIGEAYRAYRRLHHLG